MTGDWREKRGEQTTEGKCGVNLTHEFSFAWEAWRWTEEERERR